MTISLLDTSAVDTVSAATARMWVAQMDAQLEDRSGLTVLKVSTKTAPDSVDRTWYQQSPEALVDIAYDRPLRVGSVQPFLRSKAEHRERFSRALARGLATTPVLVRRRLASAMSSLSKEAPEDSISVREDPRVVLQAPLEKGTSWMSFGDPFLSKRSVVGRSTVETPAGTFEVIEVQNTLPEDAPSLRWSDYYGKNGLVRRVVTDTVELRKLNGTLLGRAVSREAYELMKYSN